jgi:uncharacterized phage protein gp47/JayE
MAALDDFPLAAETPDTILLRLQTDLNAGIDPSDPLYADMLPGSVWDDMARADALEFDRLYDRMLNEVPAAALPALATGVWLDDWADTVGLERKDATAASGVVRFTGLNGTAVQTGIQVSTEAPTPDAEPVTYQTTMPGTIGAITSGVVDILAQAVDAGSQGNVPANSVTLLDSAVTTADGSPVTVSNPAGITGGSDVETDQALQARVLKKLRGTTGAGNVDYYENIGLNYPGVGFVTVQPNTPGLGDVRVVITDVDNQPMSSIPIAGLQAQLDPTTGTAQGAGLATIGAAVTVTTPAIVGITILATIVPKTGYSVTGAGGTIALAPDLQASVTAYVNSLPIGGDVLHNKVIAAIVDVDGVDNVSSLTINGSTTADAAVSSTQVASLTTFTPS